jgi:hypothetical protein
MRIMDVDRQLSPYTGYTRAHWADLADRMLMAVRPFASADHARIDLPGPPSAYGRDSDALEAFARTFLLAAIRLRGEPGGELADWYAEGIVAGTDPDGVNAWPRPDRLAQAKVEACSIALGLHLTRPWIWDRLGSAEQRRVIRWLGSVVGEAYPPINWVWFQIVVETFLRSVDGPWDARDIESGLAVHESLYRNDGWYSDGGERAYDHYGGWALHVYPLLWAEMAGDLCPDELRQSWRQRLSRFLTDAASLVGADGSPLLHGRSLIYRYAAAAPFWIGAMTGATDLSEGTIRRACSGMLRHFADNGVPDERGLLNLGWHREWPAMAQSYSGPGSPYWAAKGFLGLALGPDHPVWTAMEEPLPVERGDVVTAVPAPGWIISGTHADGLVRIVNHGTDHSVPGDPRGDSPLYARLGYSTGTLPPLTGTAVGSPPDNSVVLLDSAGRATHRNGFDPLYADVVDGCGRAVSRARTHWVATEEDTGPDHGSGRAGTVREGPTVTVGSLIRGAVEIRAARIDSGTGLDGTVLEFSGWPVAAEQPPEATTDAAEGPVSTVHGERLTSSVTSIAGLPVPLVHRERDTSPLGPHVAVPVLRTTDMPKVGEVYVAAVVLTGAHAEVDPPAVQVTANGVTVRWPDGKESTLDLPVP